MLEHSDQAARITELEADNARLRGLLDQRNAPAELRHRLRSTMAMLRAIIRRTAETERDFASYVNHVEDRMDALMRAQAATDERGSVNLHDLLADELFHYGVAEGDRAVLSGPEVELQPRTGQILALAIHELVINAIEHGGLEPTGGVEVKWTVSAQAAPPWLTLDWKELPGVVRSNPSREGFGTEVLHQMLSYELKAQTALVFEDDGLRCTVAFPLPQQPGQIAAR